MTRLWCNGQWLDDLDFSISPRDRGLMQGLGLFETILAVDGVPIFADRHLARLRESCGKLRWEIEFAGLHGIMSELLEANELTAGRARVRLSVTGGSGLIHDLTLGADHLVWMVAVRADEAPATTSANLSPWTRNERSSLAGLKCASYAENLVALEYASRLGFHETVFLNTMGQVCEAATSNVFLVKHGELLTPSLASGCLPGITRKVVLEFAEQQKIPARECELREVDLAESDEMILTSSIRGVMGVSRFEKREMPQGPVTRKLREAWSAMFLRNGR
ncbi:MAG: aminotransferase class IV [Gloeobacteraceae cyanobacterium ES-bin-144]|nr:aminotransferase class IV [Verrucomicrobiales bacterium]